MEKFPYEHRQFPSGLNVMIDPAILKKYPLSPLAGRIVQTCVGNIYEALPREEQEASVPVSWKDQIFYVEEEYIWID